MVTTMSAFVTFYEDYAKYDKKWFVHNRSRTVTNAPLDKQHGPAQCKADRTWYKLTSYHSLAMSASIVTNEHKQH